MSTRILPALAGTPTGPRVASYVRMSTDKQDDSPARQRDGIARYARSRGYSVQREYADLGVSGWKDDRPEFQRLLADAAAGLWDVILIDEPSRLSRSDPFAFVATVAYPLQRANVSVEAASTGAVGWNDLAGLILTVVNADKSSSEVKNLSRRVLGGMKNAAEAGGWIGSTPFGYTRLIDSDTKKARLELGAPQVVEAIRWAFETYAAGTMGLVRIAAALADRGVKSPKTNRSFSQAGLGYLLKNPVYVGDTAWNRRTSGRFHELKNGRPEAKPKGGTKKHDKADWVLIRDSHPAIVTREVFEAAQRRLTGNKAWTTPIPGGGDFKLTKLLVCGRCGGFMYGSHQYKTVVYRCGTYAQRGTKGCDANTIHEAPLLRAIATRLQDGLVHPETLAALRAEVVRQETQMSDPATRAALVRRIDELNARIAQDEARLLELPSDVVGGAVAAIRDKKGDRDGLSAELAKIDTQNRPSEDLERAINEITGRVHRLRDVLLSRDPADVRAVLRSLVTKVVLHFDRTPPTHPKGRTRVTFRGGDIYVTPPESSDSNTQVRRASSLAGRGYRWSAGSR